MGVELCIKILELEMLEACGQGEIARRRRAIYSKNLISDCWNRVSQARRESLPPDAVLLYLSQRGRNYRLLHPLKPIGSGRTAL